MPSMKEVQSFIVQGRQNLQMSQRALAKEIGTTATKLCAWETGQRRIKVPRDEALLKKMAELFKCDWHLLVPDPPARPEQFDTMPIQNQPYGDVLLDKEKMFPPLRPRTEITDLAMMPPFVIFLRMRCWVEVENRTFKTGDIVKVRNTLNGTIFYRQITNEGGLFFLRPINPDFQIFPYDPNKHEILGVVTSIGYTFRSAKE